MPLKNCTECGKVYLMLHSELCEICRERQQKEFERVFTYLKEKRNPESSLQEIKIKTGVRERTLKYMLQRGWFRCDFQVSYPCTQCGAPINDGKICHSCAASLRQQMKQIGLGPGNHPDTSEERGSLTQLKHNAMHYRGRHK